ncbi:MAG: NFACT RNA binding domain-containing protein [Longimicrobiales bacterium]|nr:NFACT RNA binding domain-containing protein [Longimicrobiales bacterium]
MRIEWDAVLVSALARALDHAGRRAPVRAVHLDPIGRRVSLYLRDAIWVWDLHPERTAFRILDPTDPPEEATRLPATVQAVTAPPDDRVIEVHFRRRRGRPAQVTLVLELIPNRENALVLHGEERTIRQLLRTRDEADRFVARGQVWEAPRPSGRQGVTEPLSLDAWLDRLLPLPPAERRRALIAGIAWTSPIVSASLLDEATEVDGPAARDALEGGWHRWVHLRRAALDLDAHDPALLLGRGSRTPQPYPLPVPERVIESAPDLLAAFRSAAEAAGAPPLPLLPGHLLERLDDALQRLNGRVSRLEAEFDRLDDPASVRAIGDLLLARFGEIRTGAASVTLDDFEGGKTDVALDPALSPDENARRYYDRAARLERAAERLPGLLDDARRESRRIEELRARARAGEVERAELEEALPEVGRSGHDPEAQTLPYRRYRSSGGLEIRVGRGAARNDALTFHHSRPNDVWMHTSQAPGAHVILRWDRDGAPPARDLAEAATLAAWYSKARTSGSVPVVWTRRKHVRKPRKAPPGSVVPDRVETLFVRPDRRLEERLREEVE